MKKHIILLLFLMIPSMSFGAIVVSGPAVHGTPLEITDNTNPFGTKTSTQLRYDDYEVNDSSQVPTVGTDLNDNFSYWSDRGDLQPNPKISNVELRTKSERHVSTKFKVTNGAQVDDEMAWHNEVGFADTTKIYINFWMYFKWLPVDYENNNSHDYYQVKTLQIKGSYNESTGAGSVTPGFIENPVWKWGDDGIFNTADDYTYLASAVQASSSTILNGLNDSYPADFTGRWYNVTYQIDQGTIDTDDGIVTRTHSVAEEATAIVSITESGSLIWETGTGKLDAVKLGWFLNDQDVTNGETTLYYDNIYIDNSWARVEIGDNATYANCTHREIQPLNLTDPWAIGEINIIVNQGSFANGEAFLHVTLEDGTQLPSASITFADAPPTTVSTIGGATVNANFR